jgi:hypothetical protein
MTEETGTIEETEARRPDPMAVSLDLELLALANAARGAEILVDIHTRKGFLDEASERDAPGSVASILSLVCQRLDQLRRVIRGEEDPMLMYAPHNACPLSEVLAEIDGDIVLFPWKARGMPLVIARPSAWGVDPEEREERRAMGQESGPAQPRPSRDRKVKEPKSPKEPKATEPVSQESQGPEGAPGQTPSATR